MKSLFFKIIFVTIALQSISIKAGSEFKIEQIKNQILAAEDQYVRGEISRDEDLLKELPFVRSVEGIY